MGCITRRTPGRRCLADLVHAARLPHTPNNGFDVVSIRIQGEGSVVGGSITRTGTRLAIVRSTSIKCSAMELFDLLLAVSLECKMNLGSPIGSAKVEGRR